MKSQVGTSTTVTRLRGHNRHVPRLLLLETIVYLPFAHYKYCKILYLCMYTQFKKNHYVSTIYYNNYAYLVNIEQYGHLYLLMFNKLID